MNNRWTFRLGIMGRVEVVPRIHASLLERGSALDHREAMRLLDTVLSGGQWDREGQRHTLLALADVPSFDARSYSTASLRKIILERLGWAGPLIMVRDEKHLPPCGVGKKPAASPIEKAAPHHGKHAENAAISQWAGDSARWTQEKKLLSMHPDLRPKVTAILAALTKRGFQPKIFFGWRSVAVQLEIFKKKHTKVKFSFHNVQHKDGTPNAYAADIIDSRYAWSKKAESEGFWKALGEEAKNQNLYWGGDWKTFHDWAHVQIVDNPQLGRVKKESGL